MSDNSPTVELDAAAVAAPDDAAAIEPESQAQPAAVGARGRRRRGGRVAPAAARRGTLDRVLAVAAALMVPGGFAIMVLGWYGAAHTPFVFEQIPYLISGGLVGVGLMVAGGLLYIGSWLARLAEQERDDTAKVRELIAGLRVDLQTRLTDGSGTPSSNGHASAYVATPTGTMYHRPDCSVVAGRDDLRPADPDDPESIPCRICNPA